MPKSILAYTRSKYASSVRLQRFIGVPRTFEPRDGRRRDTAPDDDAMSRSRPRAARVENVIVLRVTVARARDVRGVRVGVRIRARESCDGWCVRDARVER